MDNKKSSQKHIIHIIRDEQKRRKHIRKRVREYIGQVLSPVLPTDIGMVIGKYINVKIPITVEARIAMKNVYVMSSYLLLLYYY